MQVSLQGWGCYHDHNPASMGAFSAGRRAGEAVIGWSFGPGLASDLPSDAADLDPSGGRLAFRSIPQ